MKVIANTEFTKQVFESPEAAAEKFDVDVSVINAAIESGKPIPYGVRYWYIDEYLGD